MAPNVLRKRPLMAVIAALALIVAGPANAGAQTAGDVAFVPVFPKLPDSMIAQFKANPKALLTTYAAAGLPLSTRVRSLVLTDPSVAAALVALASSADDAQIAAIGAGMAEAARVLAASAPQLVAQLQSLVAQSGSEALITAFIAASNGAPSPSIDAGPSGGAPAGGGSAGGVPFGVSSGTSEFGFYASGGGLISSISQSTSPSRSSL